MQVKLIGCDQITVAASELLCPLTRISSLNLCHFPPLQQKDHGWLHASTAHHRIEHCPHVPRSGHSLPCKPSSLTFFSCKSLLFNSNMCWQLYPSLITMFGLISVTSVHQYLLLCKTSQIKVVMKLAGNDFIIPFRWLIKYWILLQSYLKGMLPELPLQTEKLPISKEVARSTSGSWKTQPRALAHGVDVYSMGLCLCQRRPQPQVKYLILSQPEVPSRTGCVWGMNVTVDTTVTHSTASTTDRTVSTRSNRCSCRQ